jgi:hypothetical protein
LRHIEDNAGEYLEERTLALPETAPVAQPVREGLRAQPALA